MKKTRKLGTSAKSLRPKVSPSVIEHSGVFTLVIWDLVPEVSHFDSRWQSQSSVEGFKFEDLDATVEPDSNIFFSATSSLSSMCRISITGSFFILLISPATKKNC